ncbi:MAG TPA: prolyl oligopeptidase family serine peptidase [Candidatus Nanopelagicales bacterium]
MRTPRSTTTPSRGSRRGVALALGLAATLAAGCGGSQAPTASAPAPSAPLTGTQAYLPGLEADVLLPDRARGAAVPVVLLVPGGSWQSADRTGLTPLAEALTEAGMVAVNTTYATTGDGAVFPEPAQDVACAARFAVAAAERSGFEPGPLVLVGHSAGGHLAALAATDDGDFAGTCPWPPARVEGLVGLAGVYDTAAFAGAMVELFGVSRSEDPTAWAAGDPIARVAGGRAAPGLRVLLLHGEADITVPLAQSRAFEAALTEADIPVQLSVLPAVSHATAYTAEVAAAPIIAWIQQQWPEPAPSSSG